MIGLRDIDRFKGYFKVKLKLDKGIHKIIVPIFLILTIFVSFNVVFAQNENPKVLFDETGPQYGKDFTIYNIQTYGGSSFATLLQENGFTVSRYTDRPITSEKLKGYNVLILMAPFRNYTDQEIATIKEFVNNGGGLFLVGFSWGPVGGVDVKYGVDVENFGFNKIARSFGVDYANNSFVTDTQHFIFYPFFVHVNDTSPHPVTTNVTEFYLIQGTYLKNPGTSNVLARTDADSWADQGFLTPDGSVTNNYQKDPNEQGGPLPILSVMEYGKGKVVFMGSAATYANLFIYRGNGWKLGLNSVNWLANRPISPNYNMAGLISYNLGDMAYRILGMVFLTLILFSGLIFNLRRDKKAEPSFIKTIKNWKFRALIIVNAVFAFWAGLLFFSHFYLLDFINNYYDPNLAIISIITGVIFLFFLGVILFNIIARQRLLAMYSYINIFILLLFSGLTILLGDLFAIPSMQNFTVGSLVVLIPVADIFTDPFMQLFTVGGLVLLIPLALNLWYERSYGTDLIIEGKEFDRLKKLSAKSLPYELQPLYQDSAYIGEGGFGRVFKATRNGEEVAIKIPKTFDKMSENIFVSEVSNWSHLDHPNIVKLNDFKILPIPYIEMEFCEGQLEHGKKPIEEAISIVYDIARGLGHAHHQHIIHGDVKTSNILIHDGVYKISDWGLSKLKMGESVTISGATPQYAAPEQISREFGKADERTDIYQLGNMFYEMVTGNLPFTGEISQIYHSVLNEQPKLPSEINPDAGRIEDIIMKCLNKNKDDRYSSMNELIKDLEKFKSIDETILFEDE